MLDTIVRRATQKASVEKAVTGPGMSVMTWGTAIADATRDDARVLRDALTVYRTNRWINRAESVISNRVGGVKWHLEDDKGEEISDDSNPILKAVRDVFEKPLHDEEMAKAYPSQPATRRALWGLTSRHMGLCNVGFWHLDEIDAAMGFPRRIFYIRPDRLTPEMSGGRLTSWTLDKQATGGGTSLSLEEVLPFYLDQPDKGFYGVGLPESVWSTLAMPSAIDGHALDTLASGGRLPGIYSPKEAAADSLFDRLSNDLRTIKEMPDSAKRDVVARMPMEFTPTAADMASLNVILLSAMSRDDTLTHWGVPLSTIGGTSAAGLNSGEQRKYDEAALWQNAVQFRIDALYETIQMRLLDRLQVAGVYVQLVIDVPTFDDDSPKYDLAVKAQNLPLRNIERRALVGLDPLGDEALDNALWMPTGIMSIGSALPTELGERVTAGLLTHDEARAQLGLPPMTYDETPTPAELAEQAKAGLISIDEARAAMGRGPMEYDETPDTEELTKRLSAGLMTVDEARNVLGLGPMQWDESLTHDEIGALIAQVESGLLTNDEARAKMGLGPMEWGEGLSHDEVGSLLAQVESGVITHDEARAKLGLSPIDYGQQISKEEVDTLKGLIDTGFDPADALRVLGIPPIKHLGIPPVTLQKVGGDPTADPFGGSPFKAHIPGLRAATAKVTPQMEKAVASFLAEQKREIVARVRAKADHLAKKPTDVHAWWNEEEWNKKLAEVLRPYANRIADLTVQHTAAALGKGDE